MKEEEEAADTTHINPQCYYSRDVKTFIFTNGAEATEHGCQHFFFFIC